MPCQGTLPLMIPATVDHLARMLTPLYGAEQARVLAEDVVRKGVEVPRRGTGELVATGFFTLRADTLGQVRIVAQGTQSIAGAAAPSPGARPASDLVEAALAWLCESQDALPVVKEALRRVSRPDQDVALETESVSYTHLGRSDPLPNSLRISRYTIISCKAALPAGQ